MTWVLLVITMSGVFTPQVGLFQIPMRSREACVQAQLGFQVNSNGSVAFVCLDQNTGEIVRVKK